LRLLSYSPTIVAAAQRRLTFASNDPSTLGTTIDTSTTSTRDVRSVLAEDVDDVVIVAWLVSSGAMGAWTAYNPRNDEPVLVPVSEIPPLVATPAAELGIYRLRDHK